MSHPYTSLTSTLQLDRLTHKQPEIEKTRNQTLLLPVILKTVEMLEELTLASEKSETKIMTIV